VSFGHRSGGEGRAPPADARSRWGEFLRRLIKYWALAGGVIILVLVLITAASALSNLLAGVPFAGEYELAKHFVGIAIFTFLPYCQLTGANVTVDIFTERVSERAKSAMLLLSSLLATAFAILLLRQMSLGFRDYLRYGEVTATLHVPLWTAFPPILFSLALLLLAAAMTCLDGWRGLRTGAASVRSP
jgi:TRAP-type C4-dicarboxylate transport system permease small subunit